jgi:N-acetylglucosamine kinase-like BadF-type ATPase
VGDVSVVAVDGGNSKTDVVLAAANGTVLGRARGAGSNHQLLGLDAAMASIDATVDAALADAGLPDAARPVAPVGAYCLAGVDLPVDERRVTEAVAAQRWSDTDVVANDTFAIWRAGARADWGIGVVCGTGLNCAGRGPDGATVRFPSLGELSGDFTPGGAWLGVRGLGLALRADDGRGPSTVLARRVPAHFDRPDAPAVLEAVYTGEIGYERLFELARVVLEAAGDGDAAARVAVDQLADEVVAMAGAAIRRLDVASMAVEVVLGGGIFDGGEAGFAARVGSGIRAVAPGAVIRVLDAPPVVGAALLGLDLLAASAGRDGPEGDRGAVAARLRQAFGA